MLTHRDHDVIDVDEHNRKGYEEMYQTADIIKNAIDMGVERLENLQIDLEGESHKALGNIQRDKDEVKRCLEKVMKILNDSESSVMKAWECNRNIVQGNIDLLKGKAQVLNDIKEAKDTMKNCNELVKNVRDEIKNVLTDTIMIQNVKYDETIDFANVFQNLTKIRALSKSDDECDIMKVVLEEMEHKEKLAKIRHEEKLAKAKMEKEEKMTKAMETVLKSGPLTKVPEVDYKTQKDVISDFMLASLQPGDTWYLIDNKWFGKWKKFVGYDSWSTRHIGKPSFHPGKIDNSSLLDEETGKLRPHLMSDIHYRALPEEAWEALVEWYSCDEDSVFPRKVIEEGKLIKQLKVEAYPMEFNLCCHPELDDIRLKEFSRADTVGEIEKAMRSIFEIEDTIEIQLWSRVLSNVFDPITDYEERIGDAGLSHGQLIIVEIKKDDH